MSPEMEFALTAAKEAGKLVMPYFRAGITSERKRDNSPVTQADREAETLLRDRITARFPRHSILGEEFGEETNDRSVRWLIDPIDGTKSFIYGVPLFAVLVALERDNEPVLGVAHFPALGESLWAEIGAGAFLDGHAIRVSDTAKLEDALVLTGSIANFEKHGNLPKVLEIARNCFTMRSWGDAYGHCMVAKGKAEIMMDPVVKIWDTSAVSLIVSEAGGRVTDFFGNSTHRSGNLVSTNGKFAVRLN